VNLAALYFKEKRMPFIILKKNHENFKPLQNADDSKNAFFLKKCMTKL
jgi:hypothetical protein